MSLTQIRARLPGRCWMWAPWVSRTAPQERTSSLLWKRLCPPMDSSGSAAWHLVWTMQRWCQVPTRVCLAGCATRSLLAICLVVFVTCWALQRRSVVPSWTITSATCCRTSGTTWTSPMCARDPCTRSRERMARKSWRMPRLAVWTLGDTVPDF